MILSKYSDVTLSFWNVEGERTMKLILQSFKSLHCPSSFNVSDRFWALIVLKRPQTFENERKRS